MAPPISCPQAIWEDVETSMAMMLTQLLQSLCETIQLPTCLRVVGFLQRMEVFGAGELRLRFLQARDSWLRSLLASVPLTDSESSSLAPPSLPPSLPPSPLTTPHSPLTTMSNVYMYTCTLYLCPPSLPAPEPHCGAVSGSSL